MTEDELKDAHKHCTSNRSVVSRSRFCGCFFCLGRFAPQFVDRWLNEGDGTAVCPLCQIDSVIGDASGLPIEDRRFLVSMHEYWFERTQSPEQFAAALR
jgi:hypothetical protein